MPSRVGDEQEKIVEIPADLLRRHVLRGDVEPGDVRSGGGQQHLLDAARQREVEVQLLLFDLEMQGLEVVHRQPGLLGQRHAPAKNRRP